MGKRLQSMDVTLRGVTRHFEFDPPTPVDSDDDGEASLEVLNEGETTEVVLVGGSVTNATVNVSFTFEVSGSVDVDLSDLEDIEDASDIIDGVERGDFDDVYDDIIRYIENEVGQDGIHIDEVDVTGMYDEEGEEVDL
jgi:hypothetical protein